LKKESLFTWISFLVFVQSELKVEKGHMNKNVAFNLRNRLDIFCFRFEQLIYIIYDRFGFNWLFQFVWQRRRLVNIFPYLKSKFLIEFGMIRKYLPRCQNGNPWDDHSKRTTDFWLLQQLVRAHWSSSKANLLRLLVLFFCLNLMKFKLPAWNQWLFASIWKNPVWTKQSPRTNHNWQGNDNKTSANKSDYFPISKLMKQINE